MATLAFDSLRYARRLRDAGVPEPQADAQAELMAEAFGFYADNILTKDHFEAVLDAKLDARFAQQDAKLDRRFAEIDRHCLEQDAKFEGRFSKQDRTLDVHTWMLGVLVLGVFVPQLRALLG
ncbi:hypothetical protein [Haliea sp.]